jgi:hypothetical protein
VPKREIFDRLDFPDFYTIKSLRVGDFGVKTKKNMFSRHPFPSEFASAGKGVQCSTL